MAKLELGIDTDAAVRGMNALAEAGERAVAAFKQLEGANHGGIVIEAVGDVVRIEIKPARGSVLPQTLFNA